MIDLIEAYAKIKLRIDNDIVVTYYLGNGNKITKKYKLLNIYKFSYICVLDVDKVCYLKFLDYNMVIESIKSCDSNSYLYYNPYINDAIFDNGFINIDSFYDIKRKMMDYNEIDLDNIDDYIEDYLSRGDLLEYDDLFFSKKQREEFEIFFNMLIKGLSNYARKYGFDDELRQISSGTTSIVYELGDKIIKIGKPRRYDTVPYFEYLLQPIFNKLMDFDGYPIWVEVTQKVFVLENKDGSAMDSKDKQFNDMLKKIKVFLNSIGLKYYDIHAGNIGILLDDNKIHYDGVDIDVLNDDITSISNNNNLRILEKGNFVIIDLDSLEIRNIRKYSNYLRSIGYDEEKIDEFVNTYKHKVKSLKKI